MRTSVISILVLMSVIGFNFVVIAEDNFPGRFPDKGIIVGLEYAPINNLKTVDAMALVLSETGLTGMKHFPEAVKWGEMQKGPDQPINFVNLDMFVREYQKYGFTELTLCLKPHSNWASKAAPKLGRHTNASPKEEYQEVFKEWIFSVVERYDGDGVDDMPGLRWPVRYIEIGSEFSSYQPEPVDEYLQTLRIAYKAAHQASRDVMLGHVAFLITPVNLDVKNPKDYEKVWLTTKVIDRHHGLKDQRIILDHPQIFDFINIHNLGEPYEIEHIVRWLKYETSMRGYAKPIVISDTGVTSYIAWGAATQCQGKSLGAISSPATEADRCRIAAYFKKLVNKDQTTLDWTRGFVAADHVQRTIVAAEQGIKLINLAFIFDLPIMTSPIGKAAAGISAWAGALRINPGGKIVERYPLFYAIRQLMQHLNAYDSIKRIPFVDERARVYLVERKGEKFWIAWRYHKAVLLPEDGEPSLNVNLQTDTKSVIVETVITKMGQTTPHRQRLVALNGKVNLRVTHTPIYIFPE